MRTLIGMAIMSDDIKRIADALEKIAGYTGTVANYYEYQREVVRRNSVESQKAVAAFRAVVEDVKRDIVEGEG